MSGVTETNIDSGVIVTTFVVSCLLSGLSNYDPLWKPKMHQKSSLICPRISPPHPLVFVCLISDWLVVKENIVHDDLLHINIYIYNIHHNLHMRSKMDCM